MAFLDSTGELTDEARAAFMEAMVEEESDEEEEPEVNYIFTMIYHIIFIIYNIIFSQKQNR